MKEIIWNQRDLEDLRDFNRKTQREIGTLLFQIQLGHELSFPQSRPMKTIHPKCFELRVREMEGIYRVIYVLAAEDRIYVPHVFQKKTQKTSRKDIELAQKRIKEMLHEN